MTKGGAANSALVLSMRGSLLLSRPLVYICAVLVAALAGFAYQIRTRTIFSCQANDYSADRYIAYCNGAGYADYEHGAFWFDLEPAAEQFAKTANVLFLGNSRMQVAFSTAATQDWFSALSVPYYLLGFSYGENVTMTDALLRKIRPSAKVYVINVDDFFEKTETAPMKAILHDPGARGRYEAKRRWQQVHEPICKALSIICGHDYVIFRSRKTGAYTKKTAKEKITPVSYDLSVDQTLVKTSSRIAAEFISHLPVPRECIILTMVPTVETKLGNVSAIAETLGTPLTTPQDLPGIETFDGSHLDKRSAERWSRGFLQLANPRVRSCLGMAGPLG